MSSISIEDLAILLVTDRRQAPDGRFIDTIEAAVAAGIRAVQLREKDLAARDLLALAQALRVVTRRHAARLLINDRIDVAKACGADGVHLPAASFSPADARFALGAQAWIGASVHHAEEGQAAARAGADFVVFGPVYDTPAKRRFGPPAGLPALRSAVRAVPLPVVAIGGIDAERVAAVLRSGAVGAGVIRAVLAAADPAAAARRLLAAVAASRAEAEPSPAG